MFERFKSFVGRIGKKAKYGVALVSMAVSSAIMTVAASAEDATQTAQSSITTIISDAGTELINQFTLLATAVIPIIISIAVVGLGVYAVVYLFRMGKQFFSKAAG